MMGTRAARRYARAVFDMALDTGDADSWQQGLIVISGRLSTPDLLAFFASPAVPAAEKQTVVDQALAGMQRTRLNLVHLLIERDRLAELPAVSQEFHRLLNEHRGIVEADVTTAIALSQVEAAGVERRLTAATGKTVVIRPHVDPAIIGGLVIRVGDKLMDSSVATRLESMRAELAR